MGYIRRGIKQVYDRRQKIKKIIFIGILSFFAGSILSVLILRWVPVYFTPLMFIRSFEQLTSEKKFVMKKTWVPIEEISFNMQKAVISSEDPKFLAHYGFDFEAIAKAVEANKKRKIKLGASTITQQTVKNVFLYPARTYIRKGLEAYFTVLVEAFWDKNRILEVYLNVIELGHGIYGAEAAAQHYFHISAKDLNFNQASILAAVLPNPRRWNPAHPTNYVLRRRNFVHRNLRNIAPDYFDPLKEAQDDDEEDKPAPKKKRKRKK
jgi:monofunctional biosynthetic peptidoglycan transglycosylase